MRTHLRFSQIRIAASYGVDNLDVVGEVARLPVRTSTIRRGANWTGQGIHVYEESIDSLRTALVLSEPLKDMQVLAVTSARNSEGKTSVAVQLANR